VRDIAEQYKRRRDVLVKGLHEAGWMVEMPSQDGTPWSGNPLPAKQSVSEPFYFPPAP